MTVLTCYFDGHIALNDPNAVFTNGANFIDSSNSTSATSTTSGSVTANYLEARGTSAVSNSGQITQIRAHIYGAVNASITPRFNFSISDAGRANVLASDSQISGTPTNYIVVTAPTNGWTWTALQTLEVRGWGTGGSFVSVTLSMVELEITTAHNAFGNYGSSIQVGDGMSRSEVAN